MREIKFRGFALDLNIWVFGYYTYKKSVDQHYIEWYDEKCLGRKAVYANSVGQFTGLKDINGKEIYEGDLLQSKTKYAIMNFKVMRKEGGLVINAHSSDFKRNENEVIFTDAVADMQTVSYLKNCNLIGNIYENADLLL
jgi:uncharacterized phage protein (TIGR01671 family)